MNRHQILTGACNGGACYALGSVEGVNFVTYASGCDIVILASNFERVVTIPGVLRGNIEVSCVDCSTDTGKIAASFGRKVHIFEPTPSSTDSKHKLDYRWFPTAEIECESFVTCLSWNTEGCRLLTGGEVIQMWEFVSNQATNGGPAAVDPTNAAGKVSFHLGNFGDEEDPATSRLVHAIADPDFSMDHHQGEQDTGGWDCIWKIRPANPVTHIKFSPDSFVFASLGQNERLVKIWYEDQKVSQGLMRADSVLSPKKRTTHYTFVYISHPRAVTGFEWRQTSKYMPRGSVANMLVTSCEDNVCRIFIETILPDASLLDLEQFDPALAMDTKYHTQRHKKRFVQRLKTIRQAVHKRRKHPNPNVDNALNDQGLTNSTSVHDFHKFAIHHNGVSPVLHFHLACSINPDTDIPLLPIVGNKDDVTSNFRLHWLNNKELQFTLEAERLVQDLHQRLIAEEGALSYNSSSPNQTSEDGEEDMMSNGHYDDGDFGEVTMRKKPGRQRKFKENGHHSSHSSLSSNEGTQKDDINPEFPVHLLQNGVFNRLDRKIDSLLLDWHSSPDYVFCIHPVDGSFLVWLIDHLDESTPFTFHQAQASFSSRLPRAFPIPDARSMANSLLMFCNYSRMDIKTVMKMSETSPSSSNDALKNRTDKSPHGTSPLNSSDSHQNMLIPSIHMVTKHSNGSLNLWQASFAVKTKFQNIVSISHISRACGHRFRTNFAACHPVLPLLLTTSHHNIPSTETPVEETPIMEQVGPTFCSELILWQVVPVGPLSKSGGITELCRINNSCTSAFTSVAWVPTLLPSTSLGSYCNSPSALFVASDGKCLRLFQTVIDARSLLMENSSYLKLPHLKQSFSDMSTSSGHNETPLDLKPSPTELFNIISLQSSTHPGCVLELDAISDALQDWQNIQLIHVFQDQLISGEGGIKGREAVVDLSGQHTFDEDFYLVVVEKQYSDDGEASSVLHMWRLTIQSKPNTDRGNGFDAYDYSHYENQLDSYNDELSPNGMDFSSANHQKQRNGTGTAKVEIMTMRVTTTKVCSQSLSLPSDVQIISACVAAGHLSSASIYPACFAPYLLTTACSDGVVRFWHCSMSKLDTNATETSLCSVTSYEFAMEDGDVSKVHPEVKSHREEKKVEFHYDWKEWERASSTKDKSSAISIPGQPIAVSCAYSGRIAVAYRSSPIRTQPEHPEDKLVNLRVVIQECESTGGSEWVHEDTIELNNIKIPDPKNEIDMYMLQGTDNSPPADADDLHSSPVAQIAQAFMSRTRSVPSLSTIQSVKRSISEKGNRKGLLQQKCLVQLDWVSQEDGSHLLTVAVGSKVLIYGQVSNEIVQSLNALNKREKESKEDKRSAFATSKRLTLNKSMVMEEYQEEIKWMRLKGIELTTADGLPPLPMHLNWVRAGIVVVGMDNEMQVFTQWRSGLEDVDCEVVEDEATMDKRTLTEANLVSAASNLNLCHNFKSKSNFRTSMSMSNLRHSVTAPGGTSKRNTQNFGSKGNGKLMRSESLSSLPMLYDSGLFEAARFANPVLPQYHPKLLMELLNFGKARRVKAILAHLVRCISGGESHQVVYVDDQQIDSGAHLNVLNRQRSMSTNRSDEMRAGDVGSLNVVEIKSIPPLPLYALISADKDVTPFHSTITSKTAQSSNQPRNDYTDLLDINVMRSDNEDLDSQLQLGSSPDGSTSPHRSRLHSGGYKVHLDPYNFSLNQANILREYLFKLNLPGLSGNDQFYLAALAEVVSSSQDFTDSNAEASTKEQGSIDDCGLRFLLAMKQYQCLVKTLPPVQRVPLLKEGIKTFHLVWAFHSESTQELLSSIPCVKSDEPFWDELRLYGVGWWVSNLTILKTLILKVANVAFKKARNPMDAALYYLAMKKRTILKGLFRTVQNTKMEHFFASDFSNSDNKRIAMKNAYHLLGKGQYEHAVAFFLLSGQLEDAVSITLDKLNDLQLAVVICRLYEDQPQLPDSIKKLFYMHILGLDAEGKSYNHKTASPDPFLRSMALWQLQDYESSLQTLLERNVGPKMARDMEKYQLTPPIFNFYNYLRTHPLIIRLRLASSSQQRRTEMVSGFTHQDTLVSSGMVATLDQVTPMERQLFFAASHAHFQNGCPLVAIEVMRKLPDQPLLIESENKIDIPASHRRQSMSEVNSSSRTLQDARLMSLDTDSWGLEKASTPMNGGGSSDRAADLFASNSSSFGNSGNETAGSVDWSKPVSSTASQKASAVDWSTPVNRVHFEEPELVLDLGLGDSEEEEEDDNVEDDAVGQSGEKKMADQNSSDLDNSVFEKEACKTTVDVMAQQYKFIACLKVLMEELGNLATGFEVDGGQLRHQLYIWLEKEVEVLKLLCNYGSASDVDSSFDDEDNLDATDNLLEPPGFFRSLSVRSDNSNKASLYEVLKADKHDLQSKVERMARRKAWLKGNQHLLRTLASYCILQGSGGGGLASVHMELLLLLQELQQERPTQQLLSPLPFPTTLPLLSASITSSRSVIADPIGYLQCSVQDLLHAIIEMPLPPNSNTDIGLVSLLRDLSVALSSCIYQSLCDSDSFSVAANDQGSDVGIDGYINPEFSYPSSHLMAGVKRNRPRNASNSDEIINTPPAKWPGVASLKILLAREKDEDAPKIHILLTESLLSVYISLLISALSMYDSQMLYRLVANKMDGKTWAALFGGGVKTTVKAEKHSLNMPVGPKDDFSKHRTSFAIKAMAGSNKPAFEAKETFQEKFIPPELSMITYFMSKPYQSSFEAIIDYDSDESVLSEDDDEDFDDDDDDYLSSRPKSISAKKPNVEHKDPNSYSWCLMRLTIIKSVIDNLNSFLPQIGIEMSEVPNVSPVLHAVLKTLEQWEEILVSRLNLFSSAPDNYISGLMLDVTQGQPKSKYKALLQAENSPFVSSQETLPIKRLWFYLVKQEHLKDIFLRYVYKKRREPEESEIMSMRTSSSDNEQQVKDPMKIVHKEQDIITAFAINQADPNMLALSTQKEVVELDIGYLLNPPAWLEDDNEYDIEALKNPTPGPEVPEFLVVQTPQETPQPMSGTQTPSTPYMSSPSHSHHQISSMQTGRGTNVVKSLSSLGVNNPLYLYHIVDRSRRLIRPIIRRPVLGVRRIGSHPALPHYLTGGSDGAVKLWEWGHGPPLATLRQPGSFPKVTKVQFTAQGNKCCVSDIEGSICLWQVGLGSNYNKPIMSLQCHNKTTSDFQFVNSSSLIATAGQSTEHKNVCLWDTLLPSRSSLVHAFQCHEQGSPALVYATRQHLLISGGRKGEICIFDLRQRVMKHTFQAHEGPIKCLALDPDEDYYITGSAEGDIKVWGLKIHQLIFSFPAEHSKATFFKNVGSTSGVAQVAVGPLNHLYSCGVDGSMKFRQLPERELIVHHWA